jgi:hypothetical protein
MVDFAVAVCMAAIAALATEAMAMWMKDVDAVGPVDCAAGVVIAGAVAATVLAGGRKDYSATGSCPLKNTVAAANVGLVVLEVVIVLGMDRPSDCSL